jgi:hypothetical protein
MTLQEIIYNIKESLGSDAEEITNRQYKFWIDYYRSKLIKQRVDRGESLAPVFSPLIGNIELVQTEDVDPASLSMDGSTYKTVKTIPSIIPLSKNSTLAYLGTDDGYQAYQETSFQALPYELQAKYIKHLPKWLLIGAKIFIVNPPELDFEHIAIQGIFNDPIAAAQLSASFDSDTLKDYNIEYPISGDMLDTIFKLIRDNELSGNIKEIDEDESSQR